MEYEDEHYEEVFFTAAIPSSSEDETETLLSHTDHKKSQKYSRDPSSPPLILALSLPGRDVTASGSSNLQEEQDEDSDQPIEEWMVLGREEQQGDSSIQLNLGYWSSSSSEDDSGDEDENVESVDDTWAVSEKDKWGPDRSQVSRYYMYGGSLICYNCNRTGHQAKSCHIHKKLPTCTLCGIQGHIQRNCPGRNCPNCGLPSHGRRPCQEPPLWSQHCQRCGMMGHLSDACPDTWRQYHLTIQVDVPIRPQEEHTRKHVKPAHCYNCSERGHYGYECARRRMVSGTFPSLPYVCHYDTMEDILQRHDRVQRRVKELLNAGPMHLSEHQQSSDGGGEGSQPPHEKQKRSQEAQSRAGRRKTWPERRRERRELKRLRREIQAKREGVVLLGRSQGSSDEEMDLIAPFRFSLHSDRHALPPHETGKDEAGGKRSRKSREEERWKKRRGMKRGDIYPHSELNALDENLLSPKQRVRYRRR
ncbi:zinc finger CCHC domain-containing protein 7-like [Genypterus blacodes]|uniref:zinc finger CCHC domain-containing protein 7-like n=1 Tax=Genypterus blacodes TaxID=154954 RepID=UPI003F759094